MEFAVLDYDCGGIVDSHWTQTIHPPVALRGHTISFSASNGAVSLQIDGQFTSPKTASGTVSADVQFACNPVPQQTFGGSTRWQAKNTSPSAPATTSTSPPAGRTATRPATGIIFQRRGSLVGLGQLTVDNKSGGQDGVVILRSSDGKHTVAGVYVRHGQQYTLTGIRDGYYHLYYTSGTGWETALWRFKDQTSYERVTNPDPVPFSTTQSSYTVWKMTLYPACSVTSGTGCMQSEGTNPLPPPSG